MPDIGMVKKASELGRGGDHTYIWHACPDCGEGRWVRFIYGQPEYVRCISCSQKVRFRNPEARSKLMLNLNHKPGRANHNWKGGSFKNRYGYIEVALQPDDFFFPMANRSGYVREHRLVVAQSLGRCLHPWELVHHRNHKRGDNRLKNLQLVLPDTHRQITMLEDTVKRLKERIKALELDLAKEKNKSSER